MTATSGSSSAISVTGRSERPRLGVMRGSSLTPTAWRSRYSTQRTARRTPRVRSRGVGTPGDQQDQARVAHTALQSVAEVDGPRVEQLAALLEQDVGDELGRVDLGRLLAPVQGEHEERAADGPDDEPTLAFTGRIRAVARFQEVDIGLERVERDPVLGQVDDDRAGRESADDGDVPAVLQPSARPVQPGRTPPWVSTTKTRDRDADALCLMASQWSVRTVTLIGQLAITGVRSTSYRRQGCSPCRARCWRSKASL